MVRSVKHGVVAGIIFTLIFGMFGGTALGASARFALVTGVVGTVMLTKAGGSKEIRVFDGMRLAEGDRLKVEGDSNVTLKFSDREDEVVLGEYWNGVLSKLRTNGKGSDTALKTWSGSMYNKVERITDGSRTFAVETPISVMGARGTHFMVSIDPVTGLPNMFVSAGRVEAGNPRQGGGAIVLPAQQVTIYPGTNPAAGVGYVDPANIARRADPTVIAELLKNKAAIDEENEEILGNIPGGGQEGTLDLSGVDALERYRSNVENSLFNLLKNAVEAGTLSEEQIQDIIDAANQRISDSLREYDLNRDVPPIDRTAGSDPQQRQQRESQLQKAEQKKQQQVQQKEEKKQEVTSSNVSLIEQIRQAAQELQQANEQAQEQKRQEAVERLLASLTELERQGLQQRLDEREQQQRQQDRQQGKTPVQSGGGSSGGSGGDMATSTELALSKSTIVSGEPFTITAKIHIVAAGTAVPDGTTVTFRRGVTPIGTAITSGGNATLQVTGEMSWANFAASSTPYSISAIYAGSNTMQSSTSFGKTLTVNKAKTTVSLPPATTAAPNASVRLTATVASVSPGTGVPVGATMELYEEGVANAVQRKSVGENGEAVFELSAPSTASSEKNYVARLSESPNYLGSESNVSKLTVSHTTAGDPLVTLAKMKETETGFEVQVKLANFTATKKLYGMQLHFVSERNLEPEALPTNGSYFNAQKFNAATSAESLRFIDVLNDNEEELRESIYAMTVFGTGDAVDFDDEMMATLKFRKTEIGGINRLEAVYAQFVFEDGTTFEADVTPFRINY
jgi:hypothetical protein